MSFFITSQNIAKKTQNNKVQLEGKVFSSILFVFYMLVYSFKQSQIFCRPEPYRDRDRERTIDLVTPSNR